VVHRGAHRRGRRQDCPGLVQSLVGGGEQAMSRALRNVLTAKMLALSALALASIVMSVVWRRRQLAADSSWHPRHEGYPPHVKPGW